MDPVELHVSFVEHIIDCIKLQKVITKHNAGDHEEEQIVIDKTVKQLVAIIEDHKKSFRRSLAQKTKGMYNEHSQVVKEQLSGYIGSESAEGNY